MASLNDLTASTLRAMHGYCALSAAGTVIKAASNAAAKTGASALAYLNDGVFKTLSAATDIVLSGFSVPAGYSCSFVAAVNGAGAVVVFQGPAYKSETQLINGVPTTVYRAYDVSGVTPKPFGGFALTASALLPGSLVPDNVTAFSTINVVNGTASAFVPGTTALDTASLTVTYKDISVLPGNTNL